MDSTEHDFEHTPERRASDQDAAIERAFEAATLPDHDRRTPLDEDPMDTLRQIRQIQEREAAAEATAAATGTGAAAPSVNAPSIREVTLLAKQRGWDGIEMIEVGQTFTMRLAAGQPIPSWAELVKEGYPE